MFNIINWYLEFKRDLPWRQTKDPYKIWLSEIILQQTKVDQGINYYLRFVDNYPTVFHLAKATLDEVLLLWQGLGYYSRARNLHATAINICENYNGKFPKSFIELKKLKGIGDYTAAAISSIAFGMPEAAVDGNVFRVLSRFFAESTSIDSSEGKSKFKILANEVLNEENPGVHNEAVMELGATICLPGKPKCDSCPLNENCQAKINNTVLLYPVRNKKVKQRIRYFYFLIIKRNNGFYIEKRNSNDIWQDLYQFPVIEKKQVLKNEYLESQLELQLFMSKTNYKIEQISKVYKHVLSHQIIYGRFIHVIVEKPFKNKNWLFINSNEFNSYATPRLITRYVDENRI